jgi:thioesterase domain-containing protein
MPLTPNGKADRRALLKMGTGAHALSAVFVPPLPGIESTVAQVWQTTLQVDRVGATDDFFELGGNSLLGVRLLAALEKVVGRRLPVSILFRSPTVRAMAAALEDDFSDASFLAIPIQPGADRAPLFVIPGVNGNVIGYETLARALGPEQPVYGLRSVGLDGEAQPLDRIERIASRLLEEVYRVQPTGPYYLTGFCIGGLVAYEMAQRLKADGEQVNLLALIDTWMPAPSARTLATSPWVQRMKALSGRIARHGRALRERSWKQRLQYIRQKAGVLTEIVAQGDIYRGDDHDRYNELVMQANQRAAARYVPAPYPGHAFVVVTTGIVLPPEIDPRLKWTTLATGGSTAIHVPGEDSGMLLRPPYMHEFAAALRQRLEATVSATDHVPSSDRHPISRAS